MVTGWADLMLVAADASSPIGWFAVAAGFGAGLALFMYGLRELTEALQRLAGDRLRAVLSRLAGNSISGLLTGAGVTAVLQSSTVTTVVAIGFVAAGQMTSRQAIPIVLGANVGTTVTAQVISLDINTWAFVLLAFGAFGVLRARRWAAASRVMFGLGLLFIGMQLMADAMAPLRDSQAVVDTMARLDIAAFGVVVGAVYSALVRSSSATAALAITMSSERIIGLEAGVALVIGANIGTCFTAVLAAAGRSAAAKRVAGAHVAINVIGALLWVGFIGQLADLAVAVSGAGDVARQLANAHTIFNLSVAVVLLPFVGMLARILDRLFPDPVEESAAVASALDPGLLDTPSLALSAVRVEASRLARHLADAVMPATDIAVSGSWDELAQIVRADEMVDRRYREIVEYLTTLAQSGLDRRQTDELFVLLEIVDDLESLRDVLEVNLATLGRRRLERSTVLGERAVAQVRELGALVTANLRSVADAIGSNSTEVAEQVRAAKADVNRTIARTFADQATRLVDSGSRELAPYALERDLIEALRRVFHYTRRIAATQMAGRVDDPSR